MPLPAHSQMLLPLLETIQQAGGSARPINLYDDLAIKMNVDESTRNETLTLNDGRTVNAFERRVRWTRQNAVLKGLIDNSHRAAWTLTEKANAKLANMKRGVILTLFETDKGLFLWANAEDAMGVIEPGSVDLLYTSPPYALVHPKAYGNLNHIEWVDWMLRLCEGWQPLLTKTGSMMLHLGMCWKPGMPAQSLYIERLLIKLEDELGVHLLQRLDWHSPTKLPTPLPWVGIRRIRVTPSVEPILWLSPYPVEAKGNNRHVLRKYSEGGLRSIRNARALPQRPSGFKFGEGSFQDRGGSIPPSLIVAAPNCAEEVRYRKAVRERGRKPHPALMPASVARFGIQLATDVDDTVYDPMCGSGTVAIEAMKLGRYAVGSERSLEYLETAMIRCEVEGLSPRRLVAA